MRDRRRREAEEEKEGCVGSGEGWRRKGNRVVE